VLRAAAETRRRRGEARRGRTTALPRLREKHPQVQLVEALVMPLQRGGVRSHTRSEPAIGNPASPRRHRLSRPCPCRSSLFLFAPPVTPQASLVIPGHAEPVERAVVLLLAPLFGHEKRFRGSRDENDSCSTLQAPLKPRKDGKFVLFPSCLRRQGPDAKAEETRAKVSLYADHSDTPRGQGPDTPGPSCS